MIFIISCVFNHKTVLRCKANQNSQSDSRRVEDSFSSRRDTEGETDADGDTDSHASQHVVNVFLSLSLSTPGTVTH